MKKVILFGIAVMAASITISSCKKSDSASIVGKWNLINSIYTSNNVSDTTLATQGEYVDFRTDGKVISYDNNGLADTIYYSVSNGRLYVSQVVGGENDTLQIQSLTSNFLKLYFADPTGDYSYTSNYSR